MNKVFKALRYSSISVFFTGIISVLQGCSVEREGALFAVLLFLLNFCSGPVEETPTAATFILDPFTTAQSFTDTCTQDASNKQNFSDSTLGPLVGITAFERQVETDGSGSGDMTFTIGGGVASVSSTGVCNQGSLALFRYIQRFPVSGGLFDLSVFSKIIWPVINVTGTITDCRVRTSIGVTTISQQVGITPVAGTDIVFDITAAGNSAIAEIYFSDCSFSAGATMTLGPVKIM